MTTCNGAVTWLPCIVMMKRAGDTCEPRIRTGDEQCVYLPRREAHVASVRRRGRFSRARLPYLAIDDFWCENAFTAHLCVRPRDFCPLNMFYIHFPPLHALVEYSWRLNPSIISTTTRRSLFSRVSTCCHPLHGGMLGSTGHAHQRPGYTFKASGVTTHCVVC
jgi:hypothetical protein